MYAQAGLKLLCSPNCWNYTITPRWGKTSISGERMPPCVLLWPNRSGKMEKQGGGGKPLCIFHGVCTLIYLVLCQTYQTLVQAFETLAHFIPDI